MQMRRVAAPIAMMVVALIVILRFLPGVRTVNAVGLVASGALIGVSFMRLVLALRARR